MRSLGRFFVCVCALSVMPWVGCGSDDRCEGVQCNDSNECTTDTCVDGNCEFAAVDDGTACDDSNECTATDVCVSGMCEGTVVEDGTLCTADLNECTVEMCASGVCQSAPVEDGTACEDIDGNECTGICVNRMCAAMPIEDGTACGAGAGSCQEGICSAAEGTFACTEEGIREAVARGGGPYTFECDGPQTVRTEAEIVIGRDVILDGEGKLTVDGNDSHRVLNVPSRVTATLSGMTITGGYIESGNGGGIATGGTLTLHYSTISGNTARNSSGLVRGHGGGIYNTGTLTLNASTVLGNRAIPSCPPDCTIFCFCIGGRGDGIANEGGTVALINSTVDEVDSWSGGTLTRIFSEYTKDFESLDQASPTALSEDGWLVFGQVYDGSGALKFNYGPYPAPNSGPAFSAIATGEGGPSQGAQQLVVYNDYNCCDPPNQGHFNGTDRVQSSVFRQMFTQENLISAVAVGKIVEFSFDAKRGNINEPTGSSTASAFIQTLAPNAGFAQTNFVAVDMTDVGATWDRYSLSLTIDEGLVGQMLEFGFLSTASNFEPSGVFYDNIIAVLEAP